MKKILFLTLTILLFSSNVVLANPEHWLLKTAFDSTMKTDQYQTKQWYSGTKNNPIITPLGYKVYESNPFVVSDTKEQAMLKMEVGRQIAWRLPELLYDNDWAVFIARLTITGVQLMVVKENNELSKETGLNRIYVVSKQGKF